MYTNLFEDRKYVESAYEVNLDENIVILLAHYEYEYEYHEGYSYVLFYDKSNGGLYEVTGSHCSRCGLEGQWSPKETSIEILRAELDSGRFSNEIRENIEKILESISNGILV